MAVGAGATVMFATLMAFPISTTHALTGAIVGGGLVAVGTRVDFEQFLLPLLLSPLVAAVRRGLITRQGDMGVVAGILLSWFVTLPCAALISGMVYWGLSQP